MLSTYKQSALQQTTTSQPLQFFIVKIINNYNGSIACYRCNRICRRLERERERKLERKLKMSGGSFARGEFWPVGLFPRGLLPVGTFGRGDFWPGGFLFGRAFVRGDFWPGGLLSGGLMPVPPKFNAFCA